MNEITVIVPDWFMWAMIIWAGLYVIEVVLKLVTFFIHWYIGKLMADKKKKVPE